MPAAGGPGPEPVPIPILGQEQGSSSLVLCASLSGERETCPTTFLNSGWTPVNEELFPLNRIPLTHIWSSSGRPHLRARTPGRSQAAWSPAPGVAWWTPPSHKCSFSRRGRAGDRGLPPPRLQSLTRWLSTFLSEVLPACAVSDRDPSPRPRPRGCVLNNLE